MTTTTLKLAKECVFDPDHEVVLAQALTDQGWVRHLDCPRTWSKIWSGFDTVDLVRMARLELRVAAGVANVPMVTASLVLDGHACEVGVGVGLPRGKEAVQWWEEHRMA